MYDCRGVAVGVALIATTIAGCRKDESGASKERSPAPAPNAEREREARAGQPDERGEAPLWLRLEVVDEEGTTVPFFVKIDGDDSEVRNGEESMPVPVTRDGDALEVDFPVFGSKLSLELDGDEVEGTWQIAYYLRRDLEVTGRVVEEPSPLTRFAEPDVSSAPAVDLSGAWRIDLGSFGVGSAAFDQDEDGAFSGSIVLPDVGDTRYLSGRVSGRELRASTFDGMHAYRVEARLDEGGKRLVGSFEYIGVNRWEFVGSRDRVPGIEATSSARVVDGETPLDDPELDHPRFAGKPVIVDFFGSWCPSCMDLTPVLIDLEERYRDRGLEVLSIAIEPADDADSRRRLDAFLGAHELPWPIALRVREDFMPEIPPQVTDVSGFPVTLFLRRDHSVAAVHTGFVSPAARDAHEALVAEFDRLTREILASPAPE